MHQSADLPCAAIAQTHGQACQFRLTSQCGRRNVGQVLDIDVSRGVHEAGNVSAVSMHVPSMRVPEQYQQK